MYTIKINKFFRGAILKKYDPRRNHLPFLRLYVSTFLVHPFFQTMDNFCDRIHARDSLVFMLSQQRCLIVQVPACSENVEYIYIPTYISDSLYFTIPRCLQIVRAAEASPQDAHRNRSVPSNRRIYAVLLQLARRLATARQGIKSHYLPTFRLLLPARFRPYHLILQLRAQF